MRVDLQIGLATICNLLARLNIYRIRERVPKVKEQKFSKQDKNATKVKKMLFRFSRKIDTESCLQHCYI